MKLLCSSSSLAFIHSLRIALTGEDIETFCSDAETTSLSSVAGPIGSSGRLYVLHAKDWDRAVEIMNELAGHTTDRSSAAPERRPLPSWLVVAGVAVLVAVISGVLIK